jgi:rhodanese-related sulfurtransferase
MTPAEARETIAGRSGDPGFVLLDVRTPKEFAEERIRGAVMVDYLFPSFRNVLDLAVGITKWKEAGFPTAR